LRIRYDTPRFHGLTAAFAVGTDVFNDRDDGLYADAALRWQFDTPDLKLSAGAGYSVSPNDHELSGSMSGVHKSTGGTVTLALGQSDLLGRYHFVKLGLIRQWIPQGDTSFSMDYYDGTDIGGAGSRSKSFGLAIVQQFSKHGIEAFALWRHYDFDAPAAEYFGSTALFAGARWKF
jgi:hypothetical protein